MKYILNSSVITAPGRYHYFLIDEEVATRWLYEGGWESTVGYQETAEALSELTGVTIPVNRKTIIMIDGDEALVFRLVFPQGFRPDPLQKGKMGLAFIREHSEIGILRRTG
jgi:hypothetical protein